MIAQSYYTRDPRVRREAETLSQGGIEVFVLSLKENGHPLREVLKGVHLYRIPLTRKRGGKIRYLFEYLSFFIIGSLYMSWLYLKYRFDVIQVHTMPDILVFSTVIPRLSGRKILLDVHEPMPELFISKYKLKSNHLLILLLKFTERLSFLFASSIITVSEPLRRHFIKRMGNKKDIEVILNMPDERIFEINPPVGHRGDHFTLVYTGTVAERYRLDIAIRGIEALTSCIPNIKLWIVGEGEDLPRLKNMVREKKLENYIEFLAPLAIEGIPSLLKRAQIGISTHINDPFFKFYFSTKVVEYLATGLPVVTSRTKSIEYYFNDEMVFFFEPENIDGFKSAVLDIFMSPDKAYTKVKIAQERIKELSWRYEGEKYLRIIKGLYSKGEKL